MSSYKVIISQGMSKDFKKKFSQEFPNVIKLEQFILLSLRFLDLKSKFNICLIHIFVFFQYPLVKDNNLIILSIFRIRHSYRFYSRMEFTLWVVSLVNSRR